MPCIVVDVYRIKINITVFDWISNPLNLAPAICFNLLKKIFF